MKTKILLFIVAFALLSVSCTKEQQEQKTYPTDGLVSYFNFNNNLEDQVGTTPDGENLGNATFADGVEGKAITLNGLNQHIEFNRKSFITGNKVSVSVWVNKPGTTSLYFIICNDFGMFTHSNGTAGMAISVPDTYSAFGGINNNEWVHLTGTYDGTDIKAYINGELVDTKNWPGTISGVDEDLKVGLLSGEYWKGSVDDLFIYDKVLSQAEVKQLYNYHR